MPFFPMSTGLSQEGANDAASSASNQLKPPVSVQAKNRRKRYLDQHPEYFSADLEMADPLLYDRLIRRFQTPAERESEGRTKGFSGILQADLLRSEAKMDALAHPDPNAMLSYRRGPNGEIVAEDEDDIPANKEEGERRWRWEMEMRFLKGADYDFDYETVDENDEYDDWNEEQERYFDEEEPEWIFDKEEGNIQKEKLTGETGMPNIYQEWGYNLALVYGRFYNICEFFWCFVKNTRKKGCIRPLPLNRRKVVANPGNSGTVPRHLDQNTKTQFGPPILIKHVDSNSSTHHEPEESSRKHGKPLSCMIFFFASQMLSNLESPAASGGSADESRISRTRAHRLDVLLAEVGEHANHSPYVTRFEPIPVEMSPPGRPTGTSRDEMHDVLLLASFKDKTAWQKWIETPEWQRFMQRTENEAVFRRIPHVRCAHSHKGLRNTLEVLMA
ncbi:hypothetical protein DPV78_001527 [Talaromyces pinophilus]|nr:hypothetical protein DPV78_001527 [Talaromyces pinophilus]